jgi:NAD(P)-dependent dehydrogenase (short-subunit alcohol dehydrogenase family)
MSNIEVNQSSGWSIGMFDLTGCAALVTGAASGLGRAIATGFARFGADVALLDLNEAASIAAAEELRETFGIRAVGLSADVVNADQVAAAAATARAEIGNLNILVNAAGNNCRKPLTDLTLEEFRLVLATHVEGTFNCTKAVAPDMLERRNGAIINIASAMSSVGMENIAAYASAKGAIVQFTKVAALEFARHDVRVNAIGAGFFDTPLTRQHSDEMRKRIEGRTPQRRFADPEEIVGPAVFLASKASSFVTGATLVCDGGWTVQ